MLLATNPVKLIVAALPEHTVDDCVAPVKVGIGFTAITIFCANTPAQLGVELVIVTPVINKFCPLFVLLKATVLKLALPVASATTPVTGVCAVPLML